MSVIIDSPDDFLKANGLKVQAHLNIEVKDANGNVLGAREKTDDLILDQFKKFILNKCLGKGLVGADEIVYANDITGASRRLSDTIIGTALIAIGTGTIAPARTDYNLQITEKTSSAVNYTEGDDYATFGTVFTLTEEKAISECGYCRALQFDSSSWWFMLFRDTFTPITVPAGGSISVVYKVII